MEPVNVAIIYYSATGTVHALAQAAAEGAERAGACVRLRKVAEVAPLEDIDANPAWGRHLRDSADVTQACPNDVAWADAVMCGASMGFSNPSGQLKVFIDSLGELWRQGRLADKVYSAFTATGTAHGGQEPALLELGNVFYRWGGIIVPPDYNSQIQFQAGNAHGTYDAAGGDWPGDAALEAARYQAQRVVNTAAALKSGRACGRAAASPGAPRRAHGVIVAGTADRIRARTRTWIP